MESDIFYTSDHEWIDFQGLIAYVGISNFKLLGFKAIHEVTFSEHVGFIDKGQVLAWIRYNDYRIAVHMPVDGWVLKINRLFAANDLVQMSEHLAKGGWILSITPVNAAEREGLIPSGQYRPSAHYHNDPKL
jgi:glycine cleavage system H protein